MEFTREQINHYVKCENFDEFIKEYCPRLDSKHTKLLNPHNTIFDSNEVDHSELIEWYIVWFVIFNRDRVVLILDKKQITAIQILDRCKAIFETIPSWMKPKQTSPHRSNKRGFELENGCRIIATATTPSSVKGISINLLYLANFSDIHDKLAHDFIMCIFPVLNYSKHNSIIVTGNESGNESYKKLVENAKAGKNNFVLQF